MDQIWGRKVIEKALEYANHEWRASEQNVMHGVDLNGRYVDTPDVTWHGESRDCGWWKVNEVNVGIPYGWGNASTIEEFDDGIRAGKYAGNVPEDKKRPVSYHTVGVDCSGLLTVCWGLPKKIATRDIPQYADVVDCIDEIRQGDIFAKVGSHAMLFVEFADASKQEAVIIDATRSTGKVSQRQENVAELFAKGYCIYRKNKETLRIGYSCGVKQGRKRHVAIPQEKEAEEVCTQGRGHPRASALGRPGRLLCIGPHHGRWLPCGLHVPRTAGGSLC